MKNKIKITLFTMLTCFAINSSYAQTETKIKRSELPEPVKVELNRRYSKYMMNKIVKAQDEIKGAIYKIEVQKKNTVFALVYNENGELIDKTKSKVFTYDGTEKPKQQQNKHDGHDHHH